MELLLPSLCMLKTLTPLEFPPFHRLPQIFASKDSCLKGPLIAKSTVTGTVRILRASFIFCEFLQFVSASNARVRMYLGPLYCLSMRIHSSQSLPTPASSRSFSTYIPRNSSHPNYNGTAIPLSPIFRSPFYAPSMLSAFCSPLRIFSKVQMLCSSTVNGVVMSKKLVDDK